MPQYQGVWTLEQQAQAQSNQQWVTDPNFKNTTLLLQADGTGSGSQNQTFLDGSTNNFFITRNGNTTQGSFSPFSQAPGYWGNYFAGSANYLSVPTNTAFNFGTGNFCVEFWFNASAQTTSFPAIVSSSDYVGAISIRYSNTGYANKIFVYWNTAGDPVLASTSTISQNTWAHVAVVRDSSTSLKIYINGILDATATISSGLSGTIASGPLYIGRGFDVDAANAYYIGNVSNVRITKGGAVYTSNFNPSTTPLTTTVPSGTVSLLTCQNNRFIDNSANAFTITANGTPSVQAFGPFAPALQWTPDVVGGSGYFDGTGDYLTASGANAALGAGTFTIDGWFYLNSYNGGAAVYSGIGTYPDSSAFMFYINASGAYSLNVGNSDILNTGTAPLNTWIHFAIVRSSTGSNGLALYINGTSIATVTSSTNFTSTNAVIGRTGVSTNSNLMFGYLSGIRVVVGSANVPSGVPTSPPTAITNTQLLLNYTNAGIYDGTMQNSFETVGDAQVSTSVVKYGSGSIKFDGTGDYIQPAGNYPGYVFGTGNFTIEFWAFFNSTANCVLYEGRPGVNGAYIRIDYNTNALRLYANTGVQITGSSVATGQWNHIALCRANSQTKLFLNGVQTGSTYADTTSYLSGTNRPRIADGDGGGEGFNGFIDDLRITKGVARYIANFTPPQQALPRQ